MTVYALAHLRSHDRRSTALQSRFMDLFRRHNGACARPTRARRCRRHMVARKGGAAVVRRRRGLSFLSACSVDYGMPPTASGRRRRGAVVQGIGAGSGLGGPIPADAYLGCARAFKVPWRNRW